MCTSLDGLQCKIQMSDREEMKYYGTFSTEQEERPSSVSEVTHTRRALALLFAFYVQLSSNLFLEANPFEAVCCGYLLICARRTCVDWTSQMLSM